MRQWRAGYLVCVSAGLATIIGALLPWVQTGPNAAFGALQLRMYGPFALALVSGGALVVFGLARTMWAALVALADTFAAALIALMIHSDIYAGLKAVGVSLSGDVLHATGVGVTTLAAAGLLAGVAGLVTAVQASPKVVTTVSHDAPRPGRSAAPPSRG